MVMETFSSAVRRRETPKSCRIIRPHALNVGTGSGGYEEKRENDSHTSSTDAEHSDSSSKMLVISALDILHYHLDA